MADNDYIQRVLNIRKGISGTGALYGDMLSTKARGIHVLEPGDHTVISVKKEIERSMSSPTAYDLWYLKHHHCMLMRDTERHEVIPDEYVESQLSFLQDKLGGMKPLCIIRNLEDLVPPTYLSDASIQDQWKEMNEYFLNMLGYEMWASGLPEQFPSEGVTKYRWEKYQDGRLTKYRMVQETGVFNRADYVGYITFPGGQLGVHEVLSILKQHETDPTSFVITVDEAPVLDSSCDYFFPPINTYTGKNVCFGDHFIESGHKVPDDETHSVEWLNAWPIPFEYYPDCIPQMWMRYWIHKDYKFPVPGEFIGVLCRSMALPPHIWWFQESLPFVYAGNWVETDNLTSGLVVSKTLESERTDGGIGTEYKIKVHGWDIYIYASDFMDYAVNDRVGVLKVFSYYEHPNRRFSIYDRSTNIFRVDPDRVATSIGEPFGYDPRMRMISDSPSAQGFSFKDMYALEDMDEDRKVYEYLILPIEFYK